MEKLQFDSGVKTYRLAGLGVLRFNPGDPGLYARFLEAADKLSAIEEKLQAAAQTLEGADAGTAVVQLLSAADKEMKAVLSWVFGPQNDFDEILQGQSLLAVAGNGERLITNLLTALTGPLVEGAKRCAGQQVEAARTKAAARRSGQ